MKLTLPILAGLLAVAPLGAQNIKINLDPSKPADASKPAAAQPAAKPAAPAAAPAAPAAGAKPELIVPADGKYSDVQKMEMFGFNLAVQLRMGQQVTPILASEEELVGFLRGIGAALANSQLPYDFKLLVPQTQELIKTRTEVVKAQMEKQRVELNERNKKDATEFLAKLDVKPEVKKTASGLRYEIVQEGKGPKAKPEQAVRAYYQASMTDGSVVSASKNEEGKDIPVEFALATAIPGLKEGLQLVGVGGKVKLYVPAELAYGDQGMIPGALTIFQVEILEVKEPTKQPEEKK